MATGPYGEPGTRKFAPGKYYWLSPDDPVRCHPKYQESLKFTLIPRLEYDESTSIAENVAFAKDWMETTRPGLDWEEHALPLVKGFFSRLVDAALAAEYNGKLLDLEALTERAARLFLNQIRKRAGRETTPASRPVAQDDAKKVQQPKRLLTGWHDICAAVEMQYNQHNEIKSLNKRFGGPIKTTGAGTKPMVYHEDLLDWYNRLAIEAEERANRRKGRQLSAKEAYNYGRDGTVAPGVGGGVKKRRRPKQT
jgi:hypothetical protein